MLAKMTRELAFAASLDAGNRAMHAAERRKWSRADQIAATKEFDRLWPLCPHGIDPDAWCRCCDQNETPREQASSQPIF